MKQTWIIMYFQCVLKLIYKYFLRFFMNICIREIILQFWGFFCGVLWWLQPIQHGSIFFFSYYGSLGSISVLCSLKVQQDSAVNLCSLCFSLWEDFFVVVVALISLLVIGHLCCLCLIVEFWYVIFFQKYKQGFKLLPWFRIQIFQVHQCFSGFRWNPL